MRTKIAVLVSVLLSLLLSGVNAQWSAMNSGYAITTNYHGINVFPGTPITATAGTTDVNVMNVTFVWKFPNETEAFVDSEVPVEFKGRYWDGLPIYETNSSYTPVMPLGDWGVQAFFNGPGGHLQGQGSDIIKIRATSFNLIPEVPIAGTSGAAIAMLIGFGLFLNKKKK